jgi:hypothetical protein
MSGAEVSETQVGSVGAGPAGLRPTARSPGHRGRRARGPQPRVRAEVPATQSEEARLAQGGGLRPSVARGRLWTSDRSLADARKLGARAGRARAPVAAEGVRKKSRGERPLRSTASLVERRYSQDLASSRSVVGESVASMGKRNSARRSAFLHGNAAASLAKGRVAERYVGEAPPAARLREGDEELWFCSEQCLRDYLATAPTAV